MRFLARLDLPLAMAVTGLLLLGLVMLYSASANVALRGGQATDYFLQRQFLWLLAGLAALAVGMTVDLDWVRRIRKPLLLLLIVALALVLVPGIGKMVKGSRRWLDVVGLFQVQPSEFVKIALIIFLAGFIEQHQQRMADSVFLVRKLWFWVGVPIALIVVETDVGTAITVSVLALAMLFLGGASKTHLGGLLGGVFLAGPLGIWLTGHGVRRIAAWLDPWSDPGDVGYHIVRSYIAFAKGGPLGVGIGNGHEKLGYLPEPHTDFIFSIYGEELGLIGTVAIAALFFLLFWRVLILARAVGGGFELLLIYGFGFAVTSQALINMLVVTGTIPTTGIPLPFLSYGGSSLCNLLFGVGLVMNAGQRPAGGAR